MYAAAQQRLIDFSRALEVNAFLQNPAAQKLVLKAVEKSSDTQPYKDRIYAAMRRISDQWTSHLVSLGRAMGTAVVTIGAQPGENGAPTATGAAALTSQPAPGSNGAAPLAGAPPVGATAQPPGTKDTGKDSGLVVADLPTNSKPLDVKPVEAGKEDSALQEAQNLADAGRYQEAIAKAQGVSAQSAAHSKAQDRVRAISNRAVQELRMKAAQAFQGSLPISDPKARTAYLERARKFLEEAIKAYPQADQLGTVKENLAVITRDIERLKDDPAKR